MTDLSMDAPAEISHPFHPGHKLELVATGDCKSLECNGCKEPVSGKRYTCRDCDDVFHTYCAMANVTTPLVHPLYKDRKYELRQDPKGRHARLCDACGTRVLGWRYHCDKNGYDLHPCCANLPPVLSQEGLQLDLCKAAFHRCNCCGEKGDFWFYVSTNKTVYLHVKCVKYIACKKLKDPNGGSSSSEGDNWLISSVQEAAAKHTVDREDAGDICKICKIVLEIVRILFGVIAVVLPVFV